MTTPILTRGLIITPFTNAIVDDGIVHVYHGSNKDKAEACTLCSLRDVCCKTSNGYAFMCYHFGLLRPKYKSGYFKKVKFRLNRASGHIEGKA